MTFSRLRRVALVLVAALALGGCGVPGKGDPGVVATYRDRVITDRDITAVYNALDDLCAHPHAGEDLTLLLLGPEVVAIADELGLGMTDEQLLDVSDLWIAYWSQGRSGCTVTADAVEVVRIVEAINLLMHDADGVTALFGLVQDIEAYATISPRYGDFTLESFTESVHAISAFIEENELMLSAAQFSAWKDVNGFDMADQPDWISGG